MSSAPSEGGGARSKEVRANTLIFLCFSQSILDHSADTCKAKREARDGNVEEGDEEGAKERGAKEEGCVARGERCLAKKKTRLR